MVLLSSTCLKNSVDNYNLQSQENFYGDNSKKNKCVACIIVAIIIFVIEVAVLYYALDIAINTTTSGAERFIHIVLACLFTMPYLLFNLLLNEKARNLLVNGPVLGSRKMGSTPPPAYAKFAMMGSRRSPKMGRRSPGRAAFKMCGGSPTARFACGMN